MRSRLASFLPFFMPRIMSYFQPPRVPQLQFSGTFYSTKVTKSAPSSAPLMFKTKLPAEVDCKEILGSSVPSLELPLAYHGKSNLMTNIAGFNSEDTMFVFQAGTTEESLTTLKMLNERHILIEKSGCKLLVVNHLSSEEQKQLASKHDLKLLTFVSDEKFELAKALQIPLNNHSEQIHFPTMGVYIPSYDRVKSVLVAKEPSKIAEKICGFLEEGRFMKFGQPRM